MKSGLEKRCAERKKMVVPIQSSVLGTPATHKTAVHTLDLSRLGAKLGAFREPVKIGDVLLVQRRHKKAKCKVVWVSEVGPHEIQVGVEFVGSEDGFWGLPLDDERAQVWTFASKLW